MSRDFRQNKFSLTHFIWDPLQFRELFRFCEAIRLQSSKLRVRAGSRRQRLRGHAILPLDEPQFVKVKNVAFGYVNTPSYLFRLIVPLKVSKRPSKIVVNE